MAQFATGAVHVFLAPPVTKAGLNQVTPRTPQYFGTCEKMPQDQRQPEYEMLMNDVTGTKVPLDLAWEGDSAQISLVMTRVANQALAEAILAHPAPFNNFAAPAGPGSWAFSDVGTLMSLESMAWQCWLVYTFTQLATKAAYAGLRPGRRYVQCVLWAPQSEETGTAPMKQHFLLYAWPYADFGAKRLTLYDYNMTGISPSLIF